MDDPVAFASARLDEEEAAAKGPPGWKVERWTAVQYKTGTPSGREWRVDAQPRCIVDAAARDDALHIAAYDPARAVREAGAGRRILARHGGKHWCPDPQDDEWVVYEAGERVVKIYPCGDLRDLLDRWADHPDYDQDWRRKPARSPHARDMNDAGRDGP